MAMGILGYMRIEGWSFLDAAYMTIVTFTTVGYEEVHPLSSTGRVFTMFMMVVGVGVMLYILTSVVQIVVEEEILRTLFRRRRMRTQMAKLRNHFIVCGFGRVGREVALTLQQEPAPLVVMDRNSEVLAEAEELGLLGVEGYPTKDEDLLSVHVGEAYWLGGRDGKRRRQRIHCPDGPRSEPQPANRGAGIQGGCGGQAAQGRRRHGHLAVRHRRATHGAIGH